MTALDALNIIDKIFRWSSSDDEGYTVASYKATDICDKEFEIIEKTLKALEIIKKCGDNASYLVWCIIVHKNYNYFKKTTFSFEGKPSEEEYELVKEVLK